MGLQQRRAGSVRAPAGEPQRRGVVGANIGANKESADRIGDYVCGLEALWGRADYFAINVSSRPIRRACGLLQTRGASWRSCWAGW